MCHYYWNRVRRIAWSGTIKRICICIEKMLFSIHKICIEIEDYITTVWNPEQNVESINTIYQNSVQSSTYQKWMSNTVKALRRRMAAPCFLFCFYGSHYGRLARVYSPCRALLHLYGSWWMGATSCVVRSCRRFWNYRSISFLACFFLTHSDLIEFIVIDLIV